MDHLREVYAQLWTILGGFMPSFDLFWEVLCPVFDLFWEVYAQLWTIQGG